MIDEKTNLSRFLVHRPIEDVVDQPAGSNAGLSWHGLKGSIGAYGSQNKELRPLIRSAPQ